MSDISWIFQINTAEHGLPKLAHSEGVVTSLGLEGDRQENRKVHGGVERALCLYSLEKIMGLQEEGHPIFPGALGENLTIAGLDWERVEPGTILCLGEQVLIQVTEFTKPCATIVEAFADRGFERIYQGKHPGWSRVYARVIEGGIIRVGDRVRLS
jgi:MOSC domain-containing protein YiiM